ncbi:MAG TPA: phosphate signaling complex protein PhoU [Ignavibacteriales bacterium]|nr:phosphate signaling complex protein PhoU [Ignavibacteriales bacterium]HOL81408.1 phosphate signaling complex protein PhoU [Ignavibacteriales bacterium]HOM65522.1 phosphate signaling complex protein PhoU [Ignavibacteriales bacterium]HPP34362.1 phosphate signaling complex protein PhoU [Ignavibacteriales bacterium]HRR18543.1 phosphate signaling complex protein PhoU [Ignavibacteriales bacterium]
MSKNFQNSLSELKQLIINMAKLVEDQLNIAIQEVEKGDADQHKFIKSRDKEINAYENLILAKCETVFAKFQPVAKDLRIIIAILKINNQLERCGDIAVNISQKVKKSSEGKELLFNSKIQEMAKIAIEMVNEAIHAFDEEHKDLALKVFEKEKVVDALNKENFKYLVDKMKENPEKVEVAAHLLVLTRQIERLADHATNIAEDVFFVTDSEIVAHNKKRLFENS